jgi:hypothetical protein
MRLHAIDVRRGQGQIMAVAAVFAPQRAGVPHYAVWFVWPGQGGVGGVEHPGAGSTAVNGRARQLGGFGQGRLGETVGEQAPQGLVHTVVPQRHRGPWAQHAPDRGDGTLDHAWREIIEGGHDDFGRDRSHGGGTIGEVGHPRTAHPGIDKRLDFGRVVTNGVSRLQTNKG